MPFIILLIALASCQSPTVSEPVKNGITPESLPPATAFGQRLAEAALSLTGDEVRYDPAYRVIAYPMGDVPFNTGVCTDVVIRAYRKLGIDLQQRVHEDMKANFSAYPKNWGLKKTDTNIDHRRVPNLACFFTRKGYSLPVTANGGDYLPGDIVTWSLGGKQTHIGIVSARPARSGRCYLVVHNIGGGQVLEDMLFDYAITGHFSYRG
jgi:uncharacterized protein